MLPRKITIHEFPSWLLVGAAGLMSMRAGVTENWTALAGWATAGFIGLSKAAQGTPIDHSVEDADVLVLRRDGV